jgi:hypothetical protein
MFEEDYLKNGENYNIFNKDDYSITKTDIVNFIKNINRKNTKNLIDDYTAYNIRKILNFHVKTNNIKNLDMFGTQIEYTLDDDTLDFIVDKGFKPINFLYSMDSIRNSEIYEIEKTKPYNI